MTGFRDLRARADAGMSIRPGPALCGTRPDVVLTTQATPASAG